MGAAKRVAEIAYLEWLVCRPADQICTIRKFLATTIWECMVGENLGQNASMEVA